jgi:Xaa-Pro aminopeptidase
MSVNAGEHENRAKRFEHELESHRFDYSLITHLPNVRYLCGFTGSAGVLAFANGSWSFFTDGRYTEQAKNEIGWATVRVNSLPALVHAAQWIAARMRRQRGRIRIGVEADHLTLAMKSAVTEQLARTLPKSKFRLIETSAIIERLRMRKDHEEIQRIRDAVNLASSIFPQLIESVRAGATENEIAGGLDHLARVAGAEKMAFESIVASAPRSALPHARPTRERIGRGFVILDYGVILRGYCSDMTRTVHVGHDDNEKSSRDLYAAVLEAQLAGIAAVRPGATAGEVDQAARKLLRKRKLDRYFTHSLGHGLGLEIHEAPRLARGQTQILEPGMVITIEPGVYIPGKGGVRIEDTVLVTNTGHEVLTPTSKELVIR